MRMILMKEVCELNPVINYDDWISHICKVIIVKRARCGICGRELGVHEIYF